MIEHIEKRCKPFASGFARLFSELNLFNWIEFARYLSFRALATRAIFFSSYYLILTYIHLEQIYAKEILHYKKILIPSFRKFVS